MSSMASSRGNDKCRQFIYLYRDAGNFNQYGSVVFDNNEYVSRDEL